VGDSVFCHRCGAALDGPVGATEQTVIPAPVTPPPVAAAQVAVFKPKTPAILIVACCLGLLGSGYQLWQFADYYLMGGYTFSAWGAAANVVSLIGLSGAILAIKRPKLAGWMMILPIVVDWLFFMLDPFYSGAPSGSSPWLLTLEWLSRLLLRLDTLASLMLLIAGCLALVGARQKQRAVEQVNTIPAPPVVGPPSVVLAIVKTSGAALTYDSGRLVITGIGDVTYEHVAVLDQSGGLEWASPENRDWLCSDATRTFYR